MTPVQSAVSGSSTLRAPTSSFYRDIGVAAILRQSRAYLIGHPDECRLGLDCLARRFDPTGGMSAFLRKLSRVEKAVDDDDDDEVQSRQPVTFESLAELAGLTVDEVVELHGFFCSSGRFRNDADVYVPDSRPKPFERPDGFVPRGAGGALTLEGREDALALVCNALKARIIRVLAALKPRKRWGQDFEEFFRAEIACYRRSPDDLRGEGDLVSHLNSKLGLSDADLFAWLQNRSLALEMQPLHALFLEVAIKLEAFADLPRAESGGKTATPVEQLVSQAFHVVSSPPAAFVPPSYGEVFSLSDDDFARATRDENPENSQDQPVMLYGMHRFSDYFETVHFALETNLQPGMNIKEKWKVLKGILEAIDNQEILSRAFLHIVSLVDLGSAQRLVETNPHWIGKLSATEIRHVGGFIERLAHELGLPFRLNRDAHFRVNRAWWSGMEEFQRFYARAGATVEGRTTAWLAMCERNPLLGKITERVLSFPQNKVKGLVDKTNLAWIIENLNCPVTSEVVGAYWRWSVPIINDGLRDSLEKQSADRKGAGTAFSAVEVPPPKLAGAACLPGHHVSGGGPMSGPASFCAKPVISGAILPHHPKMLCPQRPLGNLLWRTRSLPACRKS